MRGLNYQYSFNRKRHGVMFDMQRMFANGDHIDAMDTVQEYILENENKRLRYVYNHMEEGSLFKEKAVQSTLGWEAEKSWGADVSGRGRLLLGLDTTHYDNPLTYCGVHHPYSYNSNFASYAPWHDGMALQDIYAHIISLIACRGWLFMLMELSRVLGHESDMVERVQYM